MEDEVAGMGAAGRGAEWVVARVVTAMKEVAMVEAMVEATVEAMEEATADPLCAGHLVAGFERRPLEI